MRFIGLTLCLLASSLGARADSVDDRVATLEARVKALEKALHNVAAVDVGSATLAVEDATKTDSSDSK